jgi:O-antigen/teichoic acid export membrane protein
LAVNALLARLLGPAGRGTYAALVLFATLGALLANMGLDHAAASLTAQRLSVARSAVRQGGLAALAVTAALLLAALIWSGLHLPIPFGAPPGAFVLAAVGVPVAIVGLVYAGALRGLGQLRTWNLGLMVEAAIMVIGMAGLLMLRVPAVAAALVVWLASQTVRIGVFVRHLHWSLPPSPALPRLGASFVRFGLQVWVSQVIGTLNIRLDFFVVLAVAGAAQLGLYSTAVPVAELVTLGAAAMASAVLPRFAVLDREGSRTVALRAIRFAVYGAVLVGGGLAVGVAVATQAVFGPAFAGVAVPTLILIPGYLVWSTVHITTVYFIGALQRPLINLWIALLSASIDIPLAYVMASRYGAVGAAGASSIAYAVSALVNGLVFLRLSQASLREVVAGGAGDVTLLRQRLAGSLRTR